ncbi:RNI-like protein [Xylariomycetidae sp. FL2044]|nr:RNI-like protein [Xylariomycetidae sp. FL2044]
MRPPAPSLDVIAARNAAAAAAAAAATAATTTTPTTTPAPTGPAPPTIVMTEDSRDSRSSSSTNSPAPADNEESDFFLTNNDSQSSLGVVPNLQDMQVTDPECLPTVAALPSEILISIFSRLSSPSDLLSCMLTCKRWSRNVVEILWHRPTCTTWEKHSSICFTLAKDNPFFTYAEFIKRLNLAALAKDINDGSVQPLSACTRVERLTLTNCKNLTDSGLIPLIEKSKHLLALDISSDINITESTILAIANNCDRLQGLNVSGCKNISNESMVELAKRCRAIKRLKLNDCDQLQDNAIVAFANGCPNILEIDLFQCVQVGNEPVTSLLAKGQSLRELRLVGCELVDDSAFLSLPSNKVYEHLRILDLTSCHRLTDRAVEKIIEVAPRLRNLVLAKCNAITDAAVFAISNLGKNLHYVHLGHCRNITDEAVKRLVSQCNRIRYIDLGCCAHLTDDSVTRLATLPKLKRIGLVKCIQITDDSMYALAKANGRSRVRRDPSSNSQVEYHSSSLERVHLSYCTNLTLPSIIKLLNSCPKLTHLSLTGVPAFLRDDLENFCREAPDDFTEHQRAVFCVFSGNGVAGLRRYLNTQEEFAEYHEARGFGRRGRPPISAAEFPGLPAPLPVAESMEDEAEAEDDDMGDGGELPPDVVNVINATIPPPPPPPPPPHHAFSNSLPSMWPNAAQPFFSAANQSTATDAEHHVGQNQQESEPPTAHDTNRLSSLEHIAVDPPAGGTAGASTAGANLFGGQESVAGPSTASMQAHPEMDEVDEAGEILANMPNRNRN